MTDVSAAEPFDLDAALESAYDTVTSEPEVAELPEITEIAEDKTEVKEVPSETEESTEAAKPIEAPVSWTAEAKEKFAKLPPELQTYVAQRESERDKLTNQKSQEYSEQQRKYEALEQVLAPRRDFLAAQGGEAQALSQLFQLSDFASNSPQEFIQWFAQQRGINLQQFAPVAETDTYVDPVTKQLQQKLNSIEQKFNSQEQAQVAARQETVRSEINSFKETKNEKGELQYPHFDKLKLEMASLMQSGSAKNLEQAYKKAEWANDEVREKILADQAKAAEAKRLEETKQAANKAEKAKGVTVRTKKAGETSSAKKGNWEETLNDVAGELYGAA